MGLAQNGMAPPAVTWEGLKAWCEQMRVTLEPWEARAMVTLGTVRANVDAETKTDKPDPNNKPNARRQPVAEKR